MLIWLQSWLKNTSHLVEEEAMGRPGIMQTDNARDAHDESPLDNIFGATLERIHHRHNNAFYNSMPVKGVKRT